jgi:hypothetical protein
MTERSHFILGCLSWIVVVIVAVCVLVGGVNCNRS